jgi:hypothetical protein
MTRHNKKSPQPRKPEAGEKTPEGAEGTRPMADPEAWEPIDFEGEDTSLTEAELALMK